MTWKLGNHEFQSRFILGSGKYSLTLIKAAVENAKADIVTLALRRVNDGGMANILDYIPEHVTLLRQFSTAMGYLLGMCGASGLLMLISAVCFLKVAA